MNRNKQTFTTLLTAILLALFALGCTATGAEPSLDSNVNVGQESDEIVSGNALERASIVTPGEIENKSWQLSGFTGAARTVDLAAATVTLSFADGMVNGNSGCNTYRSAYELDADGSISVSDKMIMSRKLCDETANTLEAEFTQALIAATAISEADGNLVITTPNGELVFTPGS